jgi:hypothetical protein
MSTESQLGDPVLRACVRQRIDAGRLPVTVPKKINACVERLRAAAL